MQFTIDEKKTMNRLLNEREELKKKNINYHAQKEYYTTEEIWGGLLELFYRDIQDYI